MWRAQLLVFLGLSSLAAAWDTNFKALNCYVDKSSSMGISALVETRMPMSMDNFISLVEKYERQHTMEAPGRIADALISRYRKDGMVYDPEQLTAYMFQPKETFEVDKQDIIRNLLSNSYQVPVDTFDHREECSLHFMSSHSTDTYPHSGINEFWQNSGRYRRDLLSTNDTDLGKSTLVFPEIVEVDNFTTSTVTTTIPSLNTTSNTPNKFTYETDVPISTSPKTRPTTTAPTYGTTASTSRVTPSLLRAGRFLSRPRGSQRLSSYSQPAGTEPATHPIENGVILSSSGPIALGTLLAGISTTLSGSEQTIASVLGENVVSYMPDEMKAKRLNPLYVATLAGDIGQTALKASNSPSRVKAFLGPRGKFSNSTAAPKLFTLEEGNDGLIIYLTRSEIFAGIDAMLITQYMNSASSSRVKLSQILRMYYSDRGLPNLPTYKACNRMDAYNTIRDDTKTKEQVLNFMYAYSNYDSFARQYIDESSDDFDSIQRHFTDALTDAWSAFSSFVGNYNYDDYDRCPTYKDNTKCETTTDLVVVYNREGGVQDSQAQREYITLLAQKIGVGQDRSRLGVIDARNAEWLMPVTNVSNVADLGANFTLNSQQFGSGGSSADVMRILETLSNYYFDFYNLSLSSGQNATANSQVVVWNVPRTAPDFNDDNNLKILRDFNLSFPDVYFLLVGNNQADYANVLHDKEKDFFKINLQNPEETADKIAERVCQIPKVFFYPACNTDLPQYTDYREDTHVFKGYVTPNFTTYARIAPQNFKYSYHVTLTLQSQDVKVCASRVSMNLDSTASDIQCQEAANGIFEWHELCTDSNLTLCHPIYLSISGTPTGNVRCDANDCEFPNQVEYKIGHEGIVCGAASFRISLLLLAILALLHYYLV
ncbi:uncharacterized protein LOC135219208 isoform X1 [Macrobrachium nipponense]|uniref:uncharacterized protein LOC135219208 isoform X1 n=1 Tax=Macrobrachium nipponense TaxID=159736 RepID=UPI0030C7E17E